MARDHEWIYGECQRCGASTDLGGYSIEDAPPCQAYVPDLAVQLVDRIGDILGVDTGTISEWKFEEAVEAATEILEREI